LDPNSSRWNTDKALSIEYDRSISYGHLKIAETQFVNSFPLHSVQKDLHGLPHKYP